MTPVKCKLGRPEKIISPDTLGARIRHIRGAINQRDFAKRLETVQTHISALENNINYPSLTLLQRICELYPGVTIDWLLNGIGPQPPWIVAEPTPITYKIKSLLEATSSPPEKEILLPIHFLGQITLPAAAFIPSQNSQNSQNSHHSYFNAGPTIPLLNLAAQTNLFGLARGPLNLLQIQIETLSPDYPLHSWLLLRQLLPIDASRIPDGTDVLLQSNSPTESPQSSTLHLRRLERLHINGRLHSIRGIPINPRHQTRLEFEPQQVIIHSIILCAIVYPPNAIISPLKSIL